MKIRYCITDHGPFSSQGYLMPRLKASSKILASKLLSLKDLENNIDLGLFKCCYMKLAFRFVTITGISAFGLF